VRSQTDLVEFYLGDILANAITHGIGAALAIAGAVYLIVASTRGSAWVIVGCSIFSATLILVYICSTLYHSLVRTRARHVLQVLDHSSIYLLIAGTYTPFTLVSLRGPLGCRAGSLSSRSARCFTPSAGTALPGWEPAVSHIRWASSSSPSTAAATSTPPGTSSFSPAASPTTLRSCCTYCRPRMDEGVRSS
jgi:hypothetical protein